MIKKISVFGLGLLGGSLCLKARQVYPGVYIEAFGRSAAKLSPAVDRGIIDRAGSMENSDLSDSDIIIVAVPVISSIEIICGILNSGRLKRDALVMDVGSVKEEIVRAAGDCRQRERFIGCHPMAGSEKSGFEFSTPGLYEGSSVLITPSAYNAEEDIVRTRKFWESLGARCSVVSPEEHDRRVAFTSHLPHFSAASLVAALKEYLDASRIPPFDMSDYVGNGFRDSTRIAAGSSDMWRDIAVLNKKNILDAIAVMKESLDRVAGLISSADRDGALPEYLLEIKKIRDIVK